MTIAIHFALVFFDEKWFTNSSQTRLLPKYLFESVLLWDCQNQIFRVMFSALRTVFSRFMSMCLVVPLLLTASNALSSRPTSLSLLTQNEFVDNFNPTHNLENLKYQTHDEIEKEIKEWITDEVSMIRPTYDKNRTVKP